MGNQKTKLDPKTPLRCLVTNLAKLGLSQDLRPKRLIYFCNVAWPQYELDNGSRWPEHGTFDFNILTDLNNFCKRAGKWLEVP